MRANTTFGWIAGVPHCPDTGPGAGPGTGAGTGGFVVIGGGGGVSKAHRHTTVVVNSVVHCVLNDYFFSLQRQRGCADR